MQLYPLVIITTLALACAKKYPVASGYPPAANESYTLAAKVASAVPCKRTRMLRGKKARHAVNLAVARTGSGSLTQAVRAMGFRAHHDHACTLRDAARVGYDRVIMSLRDPAARVVSGFQRRVAGGLNKQANRDFSDAFGDDPDGYVEALRDNSSPRHAAALRVSLAPNAQHWLMPVAEFYLSGFEERQNGSITVAFVCTATLDAGVRAVAARWGLGRRVLSRHASPKPSNATMLSPINAAYVRALYARDVSLHKAHCGGESAASFATYGRVAVVN